MSKTTVTGNGVIDFIIVLGVVGFLGGFVWANTRDVAGLNKDMTTQTKANDIQYGKIEKNTETLNDVKGDIKENKVHLIHIKDSVDEIKDMIKEFYSRR